MTLLHHLQEVAAHTREAPTAATTATETTGGTATGATGTAGEEEAATSTAAAADSAATNRFRLRRAATSGSDWGLATKAGNSTSSTTLAECLVGGRGCISL